ncbi:hypothetical protein MNBD_PLANCTO03-755 [hydrothermal vent metagenome]|uniref:Zinc finger DksA/TraR C4-type domain-containing protein n=1 Tax=hydrothermal vent metagenome TaxID=652676 RepID=A0A3B1DMD5_9ZZZZ
MAKKAIKKKATGRKASASKPAVRKASPTKKVVKKVAKKPVKKAPAKTPPKTPAAKAAAKASTKKVAAKKAPAKKAASKQPPTKKVSSKAPLKKALSKKAAAKKAPATKPGATPANRKAAGGKPDENKSGRKGITIVASKVKRKRVVAKRPPAMVPPLSGSILGMGISGRRPLIQSGPKAPPITSEQSDTPKPSGKKPKSPFTKRQLDKYREILIQKRHELLGDIDSMETEALKSESGSLSHLPQHMAEQGSEAYEQTLALDLAATDRKLLLEIDAALDRIAAKVYGLCEQTGKEISKERLDELPWARYSIEAAREMERRAT